MLKARISSQFKCEVMISVPSEKNRKSGKRLIMKDILIAVLTW